MEKAKLQDTCWEHAKFSFQKDGKYGFSWPQRNYRCSFCKKEFKSAQALGGHMNVHRRDRAKLRLSPSLDCVSTNSNANPNFSSSSSPSYAAKFIPYMTHGFSLPSSSSMDEAKVPIVSHSPCDHHVTRARRDVGKNLNKRALLEVRELPVSTKRNDSRVWKKKEIVRLDLNMGLFRDTKNDLDLELRLGLS